MKRRLITTAIGAGLCMLTSHVAAPVEAAETCVWRGTAPICDGECEQGERLITNRPENADVFLPPDGRIVNEYGEACFTGSKALCCKAEAEPTPAPPPPPPAAEKLKKGPIAAPSPLEGTELKKGPIAAPEPAPPTPPAEPTVTVLLDVEVYDQPGGNGNVIGELKAGTQGVSLVQPCRADHWCHVRGNVPTGNGWVWSGPGYQALKV